MLSHCRLHVDRLTANHGRKPNRDNVAKAGASTQVPRHHRITPDKRLQNRHHHIPSRSLQITFWAIRQKNVRRQLKTCDFSAEAPKYNSVTRKQPRSIRLVQVSLATFEYHSQFTICHGSRAKRQQIATRTARHSTMLQVQVVLQGPSLNRSWSSGPHWCVFHEIKPCVRSSRRIDASAFWRVLRSVFP